MIDPFAPWDEHDPESCETCARDGVVEHLLLEIGEKLRALKPEPGHWPNPASLSRFGLTSMTPGMLHRFVEKVDVTQLDFHTPCWMWNGGLHDKGYGRFYLGSINGKRVWSYAHRIAFEHWIGFPPAGYIVDHQCNHKICCNPTHTWPETNNDNLRLADKRRPWKRRNQYSKE